MLSTETFREFGADGVQRLAGVMGDMRKVRRRRAPRSIRLLWVLGAVVGFVVMASLVWGLFCRDELEGGE
jgi:hypothetical protein